jgi:hypothetical protein
MRRCEAVRLAYARCIAEAMRYEDNVQAAERERLSQERDEIMTLLRQGVPLEELKARYGKQAQEVE